MLRLTTSTPPMPEVHDKGDASGTEDEDNNGNTAADVPASGTGLFGSRGGFLRNLSTLGRERERPADVENQNTTRSGDN